MLAYGCRPNSKAAATLSADLLNTTGFIKVKPSLPLLSDGGKFDHIYAIGDVNDVAVCGLLHLSNPDTDFLSDVGNQTSFPCW